MKSAGSLVFYLFLDRIPGRGDNLCLRTMWNIICKCNEMMNYSGVIMPMIYGETLSAKSLDWKNIDFSHLKLCKDSQGLFKRPTSKNSSFRTFGGEGGEEEAARRQHFQSHLNRVSSSHSGGPWNTLFFAALACTHRSSCHILRLDHF